MWGRAYDEVKWNRCRDQNVQEKVYARAVKRFQEEECYCRSNKGQKMLSLNGAVSLMKLCKKKKKKEKKTERN